jgi:DNA-binding IclR family transcriptional regulator
MSLKPTATQKMLKTINTLAGFAATGVGNAQLARATGVEMPVITRHMQELITFGWARKDEHTGLFHPTPRLGHVFLKVLTDFDAAARQLDDAKRNFTQGA